MNLVLKIDQLNPEFFVVRISPQPLVHLLRFLLSHGQHEAVVAIFGFRFRARARNFLDVQFKSARIEVFGGNFRPRQCLRQDDQLAALLWKKIGNKLKESRKIA